MARKCVRLASLVAAQSLIAAVGLASDGVVEINHAAALAGGVTPGDAPGYPVTLSQGGSYRLTGNLNSPIATGAIVIAATMVTVDLGGFTVSSTNTCSGYPTSSCAVSFGAPGISSDPAHFLAVVRNGVVTGMGGSCIQLSGPSSEVDQVRAFSCGAYGIAMATGGASRVTRSFVGLNNASGILVIDGSTVEDNEIRANRGNGVDSTATRLPVQVQRNRIFDNNGFGVVGNGSVQTTVSRNLLSSNLLVPFAFAVSYGDNRCHDAFC